MQENNYFGRPPREPELIKYQLPFPVLRIPERLCLMLFWLSRKFRRILATSAGFVWQRDQHCIS